jgi:DNA polymerase-3 subunit alpha
MQKGRTSSLVEKGDMEAARDAVRFYRDTFGDCFFIELMRYPAQNGVDVTTALIALAGNENFPVVATNNVHYIEMKDYKVKELLNAIGQNCSVSQRTGYRTVEQYF